jgi:microcystin-dependent protein
MATLTTTPIKTFVSGETVTPTKLNELSQSAVALTAETIVNADVSASAAIALSKLATGALPSAITVSSANLVTATAQALLPAGAVMAFAMNSAPAGWLAADGAAVSRSTYATLFSAIGATHGAGDGSATFNLPNLQGIFVRGSGSQTISGTTYNKAFALKERDAFQGHWHDTQHTLNAAGASGSGALNPGSGWGVTSVRAPASDGTNGTPRTASETRPANIALLYCIKF